MRPLTKNPDNEQYFEYSPSSGFLPSVALGTLLTTNYFSLIEVEYGEDRENRDDKTNRTDKTSRIKTNKTDKTIRIFVRDRLKGPKVLIVLRS